MQEARNVSVSIDVAPEQVYRFVSNAANMSKWAPAFSRSGALGIRFVERNAFFVLDHYIRQASGTEVYVPGRVVANEKGSEVVFTFLRGPEMTDEQFASDLEQVQGDLDTLKELLESGTREPAAVPAAPPAPRYAAPPIPASPSGPNPRNLFVGGIPYELTEMELERLFSKCGLVAKCRLLSDRETGQSRGLAFVEMATDEGAQNALKTLNGSELSGRKIFVTEAKPPEQREPGRKPAGFGKKPWERKPGVPGEKRPGQRTFRSLGDEDKKPWEPRPHEKKVWEKKPRFGSKKPWERKPEGRLSGFGDKKPWERKPGGPPEKKPWAARTPGAFGAKKPWGKPDDKKPWSKPGEKTSWGSSGEKKPWGPPSEKKSWGAPKAGGFKKPWGKPGDKPGGFKKPWGKPGGFKKPAS